MYGLDKELADRQAAKRDGGLEQQCLRWIEAVLEEPFQTNDLIEALKDGVQLCKLVNAISPGSVRKINTSRMPFKQRENISNFIRACRNLGQSEHTLFTTADLFERGNHVNVVNGLFAFGSVAQKVCPAAPRFGTKLATKQAPVCFCVLPLSLSLSLSLCVCVCVSAPLSIPHPLFPSPPRHKKTRHEYRPGAGVSRLNMGSAGIMERGGIDSSRNITFGAKNAGKSTGGTVSRLNMGGAGIQERGAIDSSRNITFGAQNAGRSAGGTVSRLNMGGAGIQERGAIDASRNITFGAQNAGTGAGAAVSRWNMGSAGIQQRQAIDSSRNITFGAESGGGGRSTGGAVSRWNQGSAGIMQRQGIDNTRDPTFGAQQGGWQGRGSGQVPPPPPRRW